MIGMEFSYNRDPTKPAGPVVAKALNLAREKGVLVLPSGAHGNTIRTLPPLVISDADLDQALDVIEESVLEASQGAVE
jgi:4-aminobutyrate aminotransferase/(S)-3-amino-2-methylpropionate transaminase